MINMKVRIKDPLHSTLVQHAMFKMGCKWCSGEEGVRHTTKPVLIVDDGAISYINETHTQWDDHDHPEYELKQKGGEQVLEKTLGQQLKDKIASKREVAATPLPVVRPKDGLKQARLEELAAGIYGYAKAGETIPQEWIDELAQLNIDLINEIGGNS